MGQKELQFVDKFYECEEEYIAPVVEHVAPAQVKEKTVYIPQLQTLETLFAFSISWRFWRLRLAPPRLDTAPTMEHLADVVDYICPVAVVEHVVTAAEVACAAAAPAPAVECFIDG